MKKILLLFLIPLSIFGNIKKDVNSCNNWNDLYNYYSGANNNTYKKRFFLKYSYNISRHFIDSNQIPGWFNNLVKQSLKSNDELLVLESVKAIRKFNLLSIINELLPLYQKSPNMHSGASTIIQAEILLTLSSFKCKSAENKIRSIYNSTLDNYYQHPNFNLLISIVQPISDSSTSSKTISFINKIEDFLTSKELNPDTEKLFKNYLITLKKMG